MSVVSIISWSEMIFFYQCIFSELMTSPEPISSYCQWHLAPVSTLWNHQLRSRELICDRPCKGQQHLSSLSSCSQQHCQAAAPAQQSTLHPVNEQDGPCLHPLCPVELLEHVVMRSAHKWHSRRGWLGSCSWNVLLECGILELEVRKFRL